MTENLCVILADQLSKDISSLKNFRKDKDKILMMEVANEARYVNHHKKKLVLVFSAMRHFAKDMKSKGYSIMYSCLLYTSPSPRDLSTSRMPSSA